MNYWDKKLIRSQLNAKLMKVKSLLKLEIPSGGWVKAIRESLGMTLEELGNRVGLDKSRVSRIEQAETTGEIKISTLEKIAEGLEMTFVYGFAPKKDLEDIVREQAKKIAIKRMNRIDHSMKLEDQELENKEKREVLNDLVDQILIEEPRNFWNE